MNAHIHYMFEGVTSDRATEAKRRERERTSTMKVFLFVLTIGV